MKKEMAYKTHVLVLPLHGQGHINPLLQFSKRLASRGVKVTVTVALSSTKTIDPGAGPVAIEPVYDDCSEGGMHGPGGFKGFCQRFQASASQKLTELVERLERSENPVKCIIYDANLPWAVNLAKQLRLAAVAFFTQSCAAVACYYPMYYKLLGKPPPMPAYSMPGLPELGLPNIPSLGPKTELYAPIITHILKQFDDIEKADLVLFNSFYELEEEVVKWMADIWPVMTIGPTVPSAYLDNSLEDDKDYGFSLFKPDIDTCMGWLNTKEAASVVYVSFGSVAKLNAEQMTQMAWALKHSSNNFLWVVKEAEGKNLPFKFVEETSGKGLILPWCPQLEVLAHPAIGCFVTHCGWNSTIEALSFGVPVVGMPQFLDQMVNGHFVTQVWSVGVVPKTDEDRSGLVAGQEILRCVREVMDGERGTKQNGIRWRNLARAAMEEGGSSDKNIDKLIARLLCSSNDTVL